MDSRIGPTSSAFHNLSRNLSLGVAIAAVLVLQLAAAHVAGLRKILGVAIPTAADWIVFGLAIVIPVVVVEIVKAVRRRRRA